jgi:uncharacterized membrane protein
MQLFTWEEFMTHQPFFVPAVIIFIAAIPLILGLIPRNRLYGIRTQKTLSDDSMWYRSNRLGGWAMLLSSVIYLAVAIIYPASGPKDPNFSLWLLHLGSFIAPLTAGVLLTIRYTKSL